MGGRLRRRRHVPLRVDHEHQRDGHLREDDRPARASARALVLSFAPPGYEPFKLEGEVAWINPVRADGDNPNPGMGVRFVNLRPDDRERLVEVIRTIAYVREPA